MPRKTAPAYETENAVFPKRLKEIMKERGENQTSLAKKITEQFVTIQRQTISLYMNGQSKPDVERLAAIARVLEVSSDWLLGLSEVKNSDINIRTICDYTGLSEYAISCLHTESQDIEAISAFNRILCTNYELFHKINVILYKAFRHREKYQYSRIRRPFAALLPEDMKQDLFELLDDWGGELLEPQDVPDYYLEQATHVFQKMIDAASYNGKYVTLADV
ncbi:MAG: helix-turn-helix transcriptional regulator [Oscillibacter sp.]|nr:helix-turn-helix transcriptional regulator [Oscillibacter sp.]